MSNLRNKVSKAEFVFSNLIDDLEDSNDIERIRNFVRQSLSKQNIIHYVVSRKTRYPNVYNEFIKFLSTSEITYFDKHFMNFNDR